MVNELYETLNSHNYSEAKRLKGPKFDRYIRQTIEAIISFLNSLPFS